MIQVLSCLLISFFVMNSAVADMQVRNRFRARTDEGRDDRQQHRLDIRLEHAFGKNECISLNAKVMTGDSFAGDYNTRGETQSLGIRNFYIDISCLAQKSIKVGAIPVSGITPIDVKSSGWLDGFEIKISENEIFDEVALAMGSMNDEADVNFFERFDEDFEEYIRLTLKKKISDKIKTAFAFTHYKDEQIITALIDYSLEEMTPLIDNVEIFTSRGNGKHYYSGINLSKKINDYKVEVGYTNTNEKPFDTTGFFGEGETFYMRLSKKLSKRWTLGLRLRDSQYSGFRGEITVDYRFKK